MCDFKWSQIGNHLNKKACTNIHYRTDFFWKHVRVSHMTKISRFPEEYKVSETIYCHLKNEEYLKLRRSGLITKKLSTYRFVLNCREIQIECPVIIHDKKPIAIILPAFKIPYRPYPVFVYLFAVTLCLTGLSMRKAAVMAGKKFGILNFSHSTISRAFSLMAANFPILERLFQIEILSNTKTDPSLPGKPKCIVSNDYSETKKNIAPLLFNLLSQILEISFKDSLFVYEHFMKYCCLLI